jgi:hypothetical protein
MREHRELGYGCRVVAGLRLSAPEASKAAAHRRHRPRNGALGRLRCGGRVETVQWTGRHHGIRGPRTRQREYPVPEMKVSDETGRPSESHGFVGVKAVGVIGVVACGVPAGVGPCALSPALGTARAMSLLR